MIGILVLLSEARADESSRLLGPEPAAAGSPPTSASAPWTSWAPLLLTAVAAGGLWAWQRRQRAERPMEAPAVEDVGRHSLGGANLLHLVDVEDRGGRVRRLVVATGAQGSATLLADLGTGDPDPRRDDVLRRLPAWPEPAESQRPAPRAAAPTWDRSSDPEVRSEPRREASRVGNTERRVPTPYREADLEAPEPPVSRDERDARQRRAQALSLIDEVVGKAAAGPANSGRRAGSRA